MTVTRPAADPISRGVPRLACPAAPQPDARQLPRRRQGFTLLEVLITAVLLATLLVGVLSLYGMFASLYETGYVDTEQAQLVRSLTQQLSQDLAATIAPPKKDSKAGKRRRKTSRTGPFANRIGLLGTYNSLRLDIVQAEPPSSSPPRRDLLAPSEEDALNEAVEIVTVVYSFQPPAGFETDLPPTHPGLLRRETRVNRTTRSRFSDGADPTALDSGQSTTRDPGFRSSALDPLSQDQGGEPAELPPSEMHLPEVAALEFRYFDGEDWTDAWDSRSRGALPLAVEVAIEVDFTRDPYESPTAIVETAESTEDAPPAPSTDLFQDEGMPSDEGLIQERLPNYHFVVYLPQAEQPEKKRSQFGSSSRSTNSPPRASRSPASPRRTVQPKTPEDDSAFPEDGNYGRSSEPSDR